MVKIGHSTQHRPKAGRIPPDQRIDNAEARHEQPDDPVIDGGGSGGESPAPPMAKEDWSQFLQALDEALVQLE